MYLKHFFIGKSMLSGRLILINLVLGFLPGIALATNNLPKHLGLKKSYCHSIFSKIAKTSTEQSYSTETASTLVLSDILKRLYIRGDRSNSIYKAASESRENYLSDLVKLTENYVKSGDYLFRGMRIDSRGLLETIKKMEPTDESPTPGAISFTANPIEAARYAMNPNASIGGGELGKVLNVVYIVPKSRLNDIKVRRKGGEALVSMAHKAEDALIYSKHLNSWVSLNQIKNSIVVDTQTRFMSGYSSRKLIDNVGFLRTFRLSDPKVSEVLKSFYQLVPVMPGELSAYLKPINEYMQENKLKDYQLQAAFTKEIDILGDSKLSSNYVFVELFNPKNNTGEQLGFLVDNNKRSLKLLESTSFQSKESFTPLIESKIVINNPYKLLPHEPKYTKVKLEKIQKYNEELGQLFQTFKKVIPLTKINNPRHVFAFDQNLHSSYFNYPPHVLENSKYREIEGMLQMNKVTSLLPKIYTELYRDTHLKLIEELSIKLGQEKIEVITSELYSTSRYHYGDQVYQLVYTYEGKKYLALALSQSRSNDINPPTMAYLIAYKVVELPGT